MDYKKQQQNYSRWASTEEITASLHKIKHSDKSSVYGGIPLYADSEAVYIEHLDSHSLVIGSTGSKKTRLIGMPALQMYIKGEESFIATDPKAELYERIYPMLKEQEYDIFVLNLREPKLSNSWNPFFVPYKQYKNGEKDQAISNIIDMANCICAKQSSYDPYWENSASDLLAGLILTLFECAIENEVNLFSLRTLRNQAFKCESYRGDNNSSFINEEFLKKLDNSTYIYSLLCGTAEVCDVTRGCIISAFDQALKPFLSNDTLIKMLSFNDLDMSSIGNKKTAVFLIIPDETTIYHPLVSVFVKQCYTALIQEAQKNKNKKLPLRVNFLLDEFTALPAISDFPAMITASRSRNIRFNLLIQSYNQLVKRYDHEAEIIKGNCENIVFLHSRELVLLNEIIGLSGRKQNNESLVSVSMLQTLDKNKGEVFILHKRLNPYIANLLDIDALPKNHSSKKQIVYPKLRIPKSSIFNFVDFCDKYMDDFYRLLFTEKNPTDKKTYEKSFYEDMTKPEPSTKEIDLSIFDYIPEKGETA